MNTRKTNYLGCFLFFVILSCSSSEYDRLVKSEMKKGEVYDSLFLNLRMGMSRKDFFSTCWEMNKQGYIQQGPNSLSVQYHLDPGSLKYDGYMHFYPVFEEDTISVMPIQFTYKAFLPTDSSYYSESLMLDVKQLLERWYGGNDFIYVEDENGAKKLWVKVDGNRRIRIFKEDIRTVRADIMDLRTVLANQSE